MMNASHREPFVILVARDGMGTAEGPLRRKLIENYFRLLDENGLLPMAICFYTKGVKLLVDGSPVLEVLKSLESKKVRLIACGTCLDYYHLTEKLQVGIRGGMTDIIEAQWRAEKVITI
jgi:selenium metabolism protein YedF